MKNKYIGLRFRLKSYIDWDRIKRKRIPPQFVKVKKEDV